MEINCIKNTKLNLNKVIIALFFIAGFLQMHVLTSTLMIGNLVKGFGALLAIISLIYDCRVKPKALVIQLLLICCLLYTSVKTLNFSYFIILLIIITARKMKTLEYIKFFNKCIEIELIVAIFLWLLNTVVYFGIPFFYNSIEHRISFGLGHPNQLSIIIIWWDIAYCIIHKNKFKRKHALFSILICLLSFIITQSASNVFFIIFWLGFILREKTIIRKFIIFLSKYIFLGLGIFMYMMQLFFGLNNASFISIFAQWFNQLSNYRLAMSYLAVKNNGVTLFGQMIDYTHYWGDYGIYFGNFTIDSLYTYLFVGMGLIYFILIAYSFWKLSKYNNYIVALIIVVFSLYGMTELHCIYLTNSFALILLKPIFYKENEIII